MRSPPPLCKMAKTSVKQFSVDEFEVKGDDVFKVLHRYRGLKKSICGKPEEETQPETSQSQDTSHNGSYDDDNEPDVESSTSTPRPHSQKMKKTEPHTSNRINNIDDASNKDEDRMSEEEETEDDDAGSVISEGSQKSQNQGRVKTPRGRKMSIHVCPYENCDMFFTRPFRLAQHIRTHTGERPYVCPAENCSKSYARQQHLKRHIEVSHQEEETKEKLEYQCAMCGLTLSNVYCLRKHVQRHHVTRDQHKCGECGQAFVKQQHLQKHSYEHTGILPFPCDYPDCEMRCLTPSRLKRHKLTHQKSRYACPKESCEEKFDKYTDLQQHIIATHPKVCDICGRPFRGLRVLRKHRLIHESTTEAFFCSYPACDKYYTYLSNLTAHIKDKHKQMKIYECGICDKRLSSKQKLMLHMNTHDPDYKRIYAPKKPRKPRKDKGSIRRDFTRLLSGYDGPEEGEDASQELPSESIAEESMDTLTTCPDKSTDTQDKVLPAENETCDRVLDMEEF